MIARLLEPVVIGSGVWIFLSTVFWFSDPSVSLDLHRGMVEDAYHRGYMAGLAECAEVIQQMESIK